MVCNRKSWRTVLSAVCFMMLIMIVVVSLNNGNLNLNFVSKRRVPNGPDPIHNRKAGNTKLPQT
ncbi:hypothetical protein ACJIZ3_007929 [Penstemon smallii]|uniref:Uncharacterized protein n=1 Tax=Penstemon smallii TaxID=265156 RepID=A0ABD3TAA3_9LAMI